MAEMTVRPRSEIAHEYTWNAESVYPSPEAWAAECQGIAQALPSLARFQGRLGESAAVLADALAARDDLAQRTGKLIFYARMAYSVDTADQAAAAMLRMEDRVAEMKVPGVNTAVVLDYGMASCPGDGNDLVEAIGVADARMYENKARRKAETA